MPDPLDRVKELILNGTIKFQGIGEQAKGEDLLANPRVVDFLKVAADIIAVQDAVPYTDNIPAGIRFMQRLEEGLTVKYGARADMYSDRKNKAFLASEDRRTCYVDLETGKFAPFTAHGSHTHELFHFVFDGLKRPDEDKADEKSRPLTEAENEKLAMDFTNIVMRKYGEPDRYVYEIYEERKDIRKLFRDNAEYIIYDPGEKRENVMDVDKLPTVTERDIAGFFFELTKASPGSKAERDILKDSFFRLLTLDEKLLGKTDALYQYMSAASELDMESFESGRKFSPHEKEEIHKRAAEIPDMKVEFKSDYYPTITTGGKTFRF